MRIFIIDFEPTAEQVRSINAEYVDGKTALAQDGEGKFLLTFDGDKYEQPEWLVGEEKFAPPITRDCPTCGN